MHFEQSRPDHIVQEIHRPHGHGHMDQKRNKGNRSPIVGSLPNDAGVNGAMPGDMGAGAPGTVPGQGY